MRSSLIEVLAERKQVEKCTEHVLLLCLRLTSGSILGSYHYFCYPYITLNPFITHYFGNPWVGGETEKQKGT